MTSEINLAFLPQYICELFLTSKIQMYICLSDINKFHFRWNLINVTHILKWNVVGCRKRNAVKNQGICEFEIIKFKWISYSTK